ncbi:MAG: C39 family peptidase [Candidatus Ornithomonoglobus sp.]
MSEYAETLHGFPYYSQNDGRWSSTRYGGKNIGSSGCGPTSAAMVLKSYGFNVTPRDTAKLFTNAMGGYATTQGSVCFPQLSKAPYNLTVRNSHSINDVLSALNNGIPVIANPQGPCDFTSGGHYIVLCKINGSNQISVNDPNGNHYSMCSSRTWSAEYINKCCCGSNAKDGFWIISKAGNGSIGSSVHSEGNEEYMYSENNYSDGEKEKTVVWNNRVKENIMPKMAGLSELTPTGILTLYANDVDITAYAGNLSWKNSIYELATTMSFDIAKSDAEYLKDLMYMPQTGDIIRMVTNVEIYRGIVIKADDGNKDSNKYSVVDLGWYLNKTSQTYQFKNITAADAIKEICSDLSINIVMLPELTANINQIYFDKTISSILTDILDKCDGDYNYDFVPEGLRIYKIGELVAYPEFRIADNIPHAYSPDFKGGVSHSYSIENMVNSVKVTSEKDNVYTELKVLQNREHITQYGFLQKIVKIDTEKENADTVAQKELDANSVPAETYSFEIIEKYDSYTRAGEVIVVDGIGYVIESTDHSLNGGWHHDKLELKKITA